MGDNILESVKKLLGIESDYNYFDADILMHINAAFSTLTQLGIKEVYGALVDSDSEWGDYLEESSSVLSAIKTYVFLKVRVLFDPPSSSAVLDCINRSISEQEWRINAFVEGGDVYAK